ncbi:MAG TPA: NAD(P)/FAD-dependent oxidoreductase [Stenomitos sp.]
MRDFDIIIVGAGPAGAAAATHLARRGWRTLLIDKAAFPRDKVCGEALSPAAAPLLDGLGVRTEIERMAFRLKGLRLVSPEGGACEGHYPQLPGLPDYGFSLPRLVFDPVLIAAAQRAGADFRERTEAKELLWDGDRCVGIRTDSGPLTAHAVLLAEGRFSRLHPRLHRSVRPPASRRRVFVATFEGVAGLTDLLELTVRHGRIQTILSPQGGQRAALSAVLTGGEAAPFGAPPLAGFVRLLRADPTLGERLANAEAVSPLKGLTLDPYVGDPVPADGLVAIGDSTGFFDPLTGEGMYRALRSAELAASALNTALSRGEPTRRALAGYRQAMEREFAWTYRFVRAVVRLTGWSPGVNLAVRALARRPDLTSRMAAYQGAMLPAERFFPDLARLALSPRTWLQACRATLPLRR